jgi:putative transposase
VNWFDTVGFPQDAGRLPRGLPPRTTPVTRVRFQGVGHVRVHRHRAVAGRVTTLGVQREGRQWFVIPSAEQPQPQPLPATGSVVGIDLGVAHFLADSGGGFVPHPRTGRQAAAKRAAAHQALNRFPRRPPGQAHPQPPADRGEGSQAPRQGTPPATRPRTQDRAHAGP